jgi:hypothetical protein
MDIVVDSLEILSARRHHPPSPSDPTTRVLTLFLLRRRLSVDHDTLCKIAAPNNIAPTL